MAKRKQDREFTDAKGNLHKHFTDGRSEIYIGGFDSSEHYAEVTDDADEAVNRKRFIRYVEPVAPLQVRDDPEEMATPGIDFDDPELDAEEDS